jgi:hypothetical protein
VATTTLDTEGFEAEWFMVQKQNIRAAQQPHGCLLVSKIN